jgi:hypothetical protein
MPRYFTHYWRNETWEDHRDLSEKGVSEDLLRHVADNKFVDRGVKPGDYIYPVTVMDGTLYLLGRLRVGKVCDFEEAARTLGTTDLWEARDHIIASEPTPTHFDLAVPQKLTNLLTFISGDETVRLKFKSHGHLDQQTLRGVRELDPTSAAELDRLLFSIRSITYPRINIQREIRLKLYEDYSREEVHDIFAPDVRFTPQAGTWGLQGIVAIPDRPGDYVFFVTLGQRQGEHVFDEGITEDGVLSWQSQPQQDLHDRRIREFIEHDELKNSIYLFFRTKSRAAYTYLGRLKYLSHDTERQNPVYFQWQLLDWPIPSETVDRMRLTLQPSIGENRGTVRTAENRLQETPPPSPRTERKSTSTFRARKTPDHSALELRNRELGLKGERLVVEYEKQSLRAGGSPELAEVVRHISLVEGDGAGFDIESFTPAGEVKYIEVKTTRGLAENPFYMSANEVEFARQHPANYYLYRVYRYDEDRDSGMLYIQAGNVEENFSLTPTQYRVVRPTA